MFAIRLTLLTLLLMGHAALWVALFNRLHALAWPRWLIIGLEKICLVCLVLGGGAWIWIGLRPTATFTLPLPGSPSAQLALSAYSVICCGLGLLVPTLWAIRRNQNRLQPQLIRNDTQRRDIAREIGRRPADSWLSRSLDLVPGNQMFELHVHEKQLATPGLPNGLAGLVIVQLSDLHFTGRIGRDYFNAVIDHVNDQDADLVAVTGDYIDHPTCLPWLPETLGRIRSRHGVFFVLGNHDRRQRDPDGIRDLLAGCGHIDVGRKCQILRHGDCQILLAGNELPWFGPPPPHPSRAEAPGVFRILLSHSPDQLPWARRHGFQLMLAGHTHGGQIRLPALGPIVTPSLYGVKYASGLFFESPTLLHVTRGISGKNPVRWNCPPELARLVLNCP